MSFLLSRTVTKAMTHVSDLSASCLEVMCGFLIHKAVHFHPFSSLNEAKQSTLYLVHVIQWH